jgi:hypothetical protein
MVLVTQATARRKGVHGVVAQAIHWGVLAQDSIYE